MKGKLFNVIKFYRNDAMLKFINDSDTKEPVSVIKDGDHYKLYYLE